MQVGKKVNKNNICNLRKRTKYLRYQDTLGNLCVCVCVCAQSCPILPDPIDCSSPGSSVHRTLQARILEWVVISSSRGPSQPME